MMHIKRRFVTLALTLAVVVSLFAQPAFAADTPTNVDDPTHTGYGVSCHDGKCTLNLDLGELEFNTPVLANAPIKFDLPQDKVAFLPGGAGIEISDKMDLRLPFGNIQIADGDFALRLDEAGKLESFHGNSQAIVPTFAFANNMRIAGPFAAEFGYDYGDTLGDLSPLLDAGQRYLFFRLGSGFTVDTMAPGADGKQQALSFSVPEGESATLVIDPEKPLVYFDGNLNLLLPANVGAITAAMGVNSAQIPLLDGLILPMKTGLGITMLLSGEGNRNFLEVSGGMAIDGGALARLLKLEGKPLALDATVRIDYTGLLLQGVAESSIMPQQVLASGATVEVFVPFTAEKGPYVRIGGEVKVPVAGIAASGSTQVGGDATAQTDVADLEKKGDSWWDQAGAWASNSASTIAGGAQTGLNVVQEGAASGKDAVIAGATGALNAAGAGAGAAVGNTTSAAACALEQSQNLWCKTTGLCEVKESVCGDATETASK